MPYSPQLYVTFRDAMHESRQNGVLDRDAQIEFATNKVMKTYPDATHPDLEDVVNSFFESISIKNSDLVFEQLYTAMYEARKRGVLDWQDQIRLAMDEIQSIHPMSTLDEIKQSLNPILDFSSTNDTACISEIENHIASLENKIRDELSDLDLPERSSFRNPFIAIKKALERSDAVKGRRVNLLCALQYIRGARQNFCLGASFAASSCLIHAADIIYSADAKAGYKIRVKKNRDYSRPPSSMDDYEAWANMFESLRESDINKKKYKYDYQIYFEISKIIHANDLMNNPDATEIKPDSIGRGIRKFKDFLNPQEKMGRKAARPKRPS